jgi:hypothetical protein
MSTPRIKKTTRDFKEFQKKAANETSTNHRKIFI